MDEFTRRRLIALENRLADNTVTLGATQPSAPVTGTTLYGKSRASRVLPAFVSSLGPAMALQPHLARGIAMFMPHGDGTTTSEIGSAWTANGTPTAANWASTNRLTQVKRISYSTGGIAGSTAGIREGARRYWLGNAANMGGFHIVWRFGLSTITATRRWFVGLLGTTAVYGNADPSTIANSIIVGQDVADTTIQFMHNDGAGTATKNAGSTSLVSPTTSNLYEVHIYAPPNASSVYMSCEDEAGNISTYTATTDLPANTTNLAIYAACGNATTASAMIMDVAKIYAETDY